MAIYTSKKKVLAFVFGLNGRYSRQVSAMRLSIVTIYILEEAWEFQVFSMEISDLRSVGPTFWNVLVRTISVIKDSKCQVHMC